MFRTVSDFLDEWKSESQATLKVFGALTEESLSQRVTPTGRSLGFLAWHITTSLTEMMHTAGLPVEVTAGDQPQSPQMLAEIYKRDADAVAEAVGRNWTDARLPEKIPMYGEEWTRAFTLRCMIAHQCHHRGQMTVLMRQAGLRVQACTDPRPRSGPPTA
jgi:uncharacterized damage-inducible protein DinB